MPKNPTQNLMPKMRTVLSAVFLTLLSVPFGNAVSAVVPADLQTEYCTEPLGMDNPKPAFRWLVPDNGGKNVKQTAYRILVASSLELLNKEQGDIWDTGKTESGNSTQVIYQTQPPVCSTAPPRKANEGKDLQSAAKYFWKVKTWTTSTSETSQTEHESDWSEPASFVTGLIAGNDALPEKSVAGNSPGEETERWTIDAWIKHPSAAENKCIRFRHSYLCTEKYKSAYAFVASVGYHELYINGQKVDDRHLAPPVMNYLKRIPYATYDVTKYLKEGKNTVAVWTGAGWARNEAFKMKQALYVRLQMTGENGECCGFYSDGNWKCAESDTEETTEKTRYKNFGGELLDARKSEPDWCQPDFDDSGWQKVKIVDNMKTPVASAFRTPATKIIKEYKPVSVTETKDGICVLFPENFTGWAEFPVTGLNAGDKVTILTADDTEHICDFNQKSIFISAGKGDEKFRYRFNYAAGLHVTLQGLKNKSDAENIRGYALATDFRQTGRFRSSNELYNKIYALDLWTFRANTPEGTTFDCPHRERMGYGETGTSTGWGIGLPNYQSGAFYAEMVQNWADVQEESGWIPHVAPVPYKSGGGPLWSSTGLDIAWEHYVHFGDKRVLETAYPMAKKWLDFCHKNTKDGLLQPYLKGQMLFLGDWAAPGGRKEFGGTPQATYFNNCVYAWNLETMAALCKALGKNDDVQFYERRLADLKADIIKTYYKKETGQLMDGGQVQQAFALLTSLSGDSNVRDHIRHALQQAFTEKPYFDMGSSGLPVLLHYIIDSGDKAANEKAAEFLNSIKQPGYGYFLEQGETTLPEYWEVNVDSKIHTCYTGITAWLMKSLAGIRPNPKEPGYRRFIIAPQYVKETDWVEGETESPYGIIKSRWERRGNTVTLKISVPPNSEAEVTLPDGEIKTVGSGEYTF